MMNSDLGLRFPPICPGFLQLFGPEASIQWLDEQSGRFLVLVRGCGVTQVGEGVPEEKKVGTPTPPLPVVVETSSILQVPCSIPEQTTPCVVGPPRTACKVQIAVPTLLCVSMGARPGPSPADGRTVPIRIGFFSPAVRVALSLE